MFRGWVTRGPDASQRLPTPMARVGGYRHARCNVPGVMRSLRNVAPRNVGHSFLSCFLLLSFLTQACGAQSPQDDTEESNVEAAATGTLGGRVTSAQEGPME